MLRAPIPPSKSPVSEGESLIDFSRFTGRPDAPIPVFKDFEPDWLSSLAARGEAKVYTKENSRNFDYIGMPIGGIGCGLLYLGGDGKLWRWDIFDAENPDTMSYEAGEAYKFPLKQADADIPTRGLKQGFALSVDSGPVRTMDRNGFEQVRFLGQYPVGEVSYADPGCAVEVQLQAFSPFIPLDVENSTFPATILRYTFRNISKKVVQCNFGGWLENGNAPKTRQVSKGSLTNRINLEDRSVALSLSAESDTHHRLQSDIGTQCLLLLAEGKLTGTAEAGSIPCADCPAEVKESATLPFAGAARGRSLVGSVGTAFELGAGTSMTVTCILAWHNPNPTSVPLRTNRRRACTSRFKDALEVARAVADRLESLRTQTLLWRDTWYDSTLPAWFLDRTFANTSILASNTFYHFADGRFYGNEGSYSCAGTCAHVYSYAQAIGRLFPAIERDLRERVDLGISLDLPTGRIGNRGELEDSFAYDGQCGTILRVYREHLHSPDESFLRRNWEKVKVCFNPLFALDPNEEGLLSGSQHNTLDSSWHGKIAWISGLYVAALRAGSVMAAICGDEAFATHCTTLADKGTKALTTQLFRDGYFINEVDPSQPETTNSGLGCEIDQVFGQSWAFQVGLPRVFERDETLSALNALWRNNFTTDVGPYIEQNRGGRIYAMAGEAGLLMCTFPREAWDFAKASGGGKGAFPFYFHECMTGFEYQVAAHMIWEGYVAEGLAITRAIHDRYDGSKRNPWNEVECGSHYSRAMASYGVYLAACGFRYDGPKGMLSFAPRIRPENFRAAFTAAEGWGTYSQNIKDEEMSAEIHVKWGGLRLCELVLHAPTKQNLATARASVDGSEVATELTSSEGRITVRFGVELQLRAGSSICVKLC